MYWIKLPLTSQQLGLWPAVPCWWHSEQDSGLSHKLRALPEVSNDCCSSIHLPTLTRDSGKNIWESPMPICWTCFKQSKVRQLQPILFPSTTNSGTWDSSLLSWCIYFFISVGEKIKEFTMSNENWDKLARLFFFHRTKCPSVHYTYIIRPTLDKGRTPVCCSGLEHPIGLK